MKVSHPSNQHTRGAGLRDHTLNLSMNQNRAMSDGYFNKRQPGGQSARRRPVAGINATRGLFFALLIVAAGCTSIYHRTRSDLPPEPAAEAELRISEARKAEDQARQSGRKLLGHLRQAKPGATISADFDRLEAAAFELERRALAARDAVEPPGGNPEVTSAIEVLLHTAQSWLAYVQTNRSVEPATQVGQLEALLDRTPESRGPSK
jgi:hypothetical protein